MLKKNSYFHFYIKKNNFNKIKTPNELKKWFINNKEIWNIPN